MSSTFAVSGNWRRGNGRRSAAGSRPEPGNRASLYRVTGETSQLKENNFVWQIIIWPFINRPDTDGIHEEEEVGYAECYPGLQVCVKWTRTCELAVVGFVILASYRISPNIPKLKTSLSPKLILHCWFLGAGIFKWSGPKNDYQTHWHILITFS